MNFYIDSDYRLHISNQDNTFRKIDMNIINQDFFNNKCDTFIEGYRYIPSGETWVREDGSEFIGEMIAPWKSYTELDAAQREYEKQLLNTYIIEKEELNSSYQEGINSI